jgi:predicted DNA-binding protein YlxM (UPF0122 family)
MEVKLSVVDTRLNRKVEYGMLASFYVSMLTDRQASVIRLYCNEDLSYGEIAEQLGISRQGVSSTLLRSFDKLDELEKDLGLAKAFYKLTELSSILSEINTDDPSIIRAKQIIGSMISVEEEKHGI